MCIWSSTYLHLSDIVWAAHDNKQELLLSHRINFEFHWFPPQNLYHLLELLELSIWEKGFHFVLNFCFPRFFSKETDSYEPMKDTFIAITPLFILIWITTLTCSSFDPWLSCSPLCPETTPHYPHPTTRIWSLAHFGTHVWNLT